MKTVDRMLVFDVDGVITNPKKKRVTEPEILDEIIKQLEKSDPAALVTGRAHEWIIDRVIGLIENKAQDRIILDNLFISKEFGGAYSIYENGVRKDFSNEHSTISKDLLNEVSKIVNNNFSDSMFVDPDKKTMISIEMKDNFSIEKFRIFQGEFLKEIRKIIRKYDPDQQLDVHVDIIATNIRNKNSNKRYATKQLLGWLSDKKISPKKYFVFGDTVGDRDIAQELYEGKFPVKFVFVGEKTELGTTKSDFTIIFPQSKYDKGTLEFLKTL
jgi:hypothetical protein